MQQGAIHRGRPAGQMTRRRRQVLDYVLARQRQGEPVLIGPMVRTCKLVDRSSAKRILKELRDYGFISAKNDRGY